MPQDLAAPLRQALSAALPRLQTLSPTQWTERPAAGGWNRKEELGHLLDSAANNRLRFVRGALHGESRDPGYEQNAWVLLHNYDALEPAMLVNAWQYENLLLAHLIEQIPAGSLDAPCHIREAAPVTLRFVIEDYVRHLQHHLDHILLLSRSDH